MKKLLLYTSVLFFLVTVVGCSNNENQLEEQLEALVKTNWGNKMLHERNFYQRIISELSSDNKNVNYLKGIGTNQRDFYTINHRDDKGSILDIIEQYYEKEEIEKINAVLLKVKNTSFALANHLENEDLLVLYQNKQFINSLEFLIKGYVNGQGSVISSDDLTLINIIKYPENVSNNYSSSEIMNFLNDIENKIDILSQYIIKAE